MKLINVTLTSYNQKRRCFYSQNYIYIGAGSTVFAQNLLGDILSFPELAEARIALHDIDPERSEYR